MANQYTSRTVTQRFWDKVDKTPNPKGCWIWTAYIDKDGYGQFAYRGRMRGAHRVSWEFLHGELLDELDVLHTCDNPSCVNPEHLFLGTAAENSKDMILKGRHKNHPLPGEANPMHVLTEAEVIEIRRLYETGRVYQSTLAKEFGVSQSQISNIVIRKSWKGMG